MRDKIEELMILGVPVYFHTDKDGYTSIETDGYPAGSEQFQAIRKALEGLQTDEDREVTAIMRSHHSRIR